MLPWGVGARLAHGLRGLPLRGAALYGQNRGHATVVMARPTAGYHRGLLLASATFITGAAAYSTSGATTCKESPGPQVIAGMIKQGLPEYSRKQISEHDSREKRIWVTYRDGVYDVTEFVEAHPGGKKILLAAGKSIEPFWALYGVHKSEDTFTLLETLRIGNIVEADRIAISEEEETGPYSTDPVRNPAMIFHTNKPCNAEPPAALLADEYITPGEVFFVRNHLPVPVVKPEDYRLVIEVEGGSNKVVTLQDLKTKFKKHEVTATIQCAGNRRVEVQNMPDKKHAKGLSWRVGAISNATWAGARLRDVLLWAGVNEDEIEHVHFEGMDGDSESGYTSSIPAIKAMDKNGDVLLAYEMNGEDIPRDHGYPVRALCPGIVAARSVKWLAKVKANKEEGKGQFMVKDYKVFNSSTNWDNVDWNKPPAMQEVPVQSAILDPSPGDQVSPDDETITVKGYAWAGGGRGIQRVDISIDGGKEWSDAVLLHQDKRQPYGREWAWTLWEAEVPVPKKHNGKIEIICKATDSAANTQPERAESIWNIRGVAVNPWHRVEVNAPKPAFGKDELVRYGGVVAGVAFGVVAASLMGKGA